MTSFVTVKEAARLVGKSPSSIRRLIYPIIEADNHPDRPHIRPTVEEVPQLRLKGENFAWRVSEELLRREIPVSEPTGPASSSHAGGAPAGESSLTEMLRKELDIKNAQITQQGDLIARQMELISGLSERLREGNVLMATLQQRLSPPSMTVEQGIVKSVPSKPTPPPKPAAPAKPQAAPKKRPRRGFLGLFRSRG
jgi:hypothetical protein